MTYHVEDLFPGIPAGDYRDDINLHRKICTLSMVPFPGWDPGLYDYRQITEQYAFIHCLFHLTIDVSSFFTPLIHRLPCHDGL